MSTSAAAGRPSGSTVGTGSRRPPSAEASTSMKPGPPSANGLVTVSSSGRAACQPSAIASAACTAVSVPANLSGQISTRTGVESASSQVHLGRIMGG